MRSERDSSRTYADVPAERFQRPEDAFRNEKVVSERAGFQQP
jgi:hypothetical protein